jgi:hypothetical protein
MITDTAPASAEPVDTCRPTSAEQARNKLPVTRDLRWCLATSIDTIHREEYEIWIWTQLNDIARRFSYLKLLKSLRPPLRSRSGFLATDPEVPGSIPGPTRFSEK